MVLGLILIFQFLQGDQASIVGGAIEFVKELEHILQSLEAKKFALLEHGNVTNKEHHQQSNDDEHKQIGSPFAQFFAYPQFSCSHSQLGNKYTSQSKAAIADIEVTLIETHANIRVLSRRRVRQLSKMVASFHSVFLTILHLNVTTLDSLVLYSISAKVRVDVHWINSTRILVHSFETYLSLPSHITMSPTTK